MHGPSHGGGSSFGGGVSGGGSFGPSPSGSFNSFGGGMSTGPVMRRRPPIFHFFGRTIVFTSGKLVFSIFMIIALIMSSVVCYSSVSGYNSTTQEIAYYQSDEAGYHELIDKAQNHDDGYYLKTFDDINFKPHSQYILNGYRYSNCYIYKHGDDVLIGSYYLRYDGLLYYQIVYDFYDEGRHVYGLTYACYKDTEVATMTSFTVAYHYEGKVIDSINSDYDLEDCMDYYQTLQEQENYKNSMIIFIVVLVAEVAGIVLFVVIIVKRAKKDEELKDEKMQAEIDKTNAETELVRAETKKKNRICAYCGNPVPDDAEVCPSCGSRQHASKE